MYMPGTPPIPSPKHVEQHQRKIAWLLKIADEKGDPAAVEEAKRLGDPDILDNLHAALTERKREGANPLE